MSATTWLAGAAGLLMLLKGKSGAGAGGAPNATPAQQKNVEQAIAGRATELIAEAGIATTSARMAQARSIGYATAQSRGLGAEAQAIYRAAKDAAAAAGLPEGVFLTQLPGTMAVPYKWPNGSTSNVYMYPDQYQATVLAARGELNGYGSCCRGRR